MIDKEKLKKRFSNQAKVYDAHAHVQKEMAKRLLEKIAVGRRIHSILEIGCGTGYLTQVLLERFPQARITSLDIAEGMISYAEKRFAGHRKLKLVCADIEVFETQERYDLIISNAAFQWLNDPHHTVKRLCNYLAEEAQLVFSTFGERTFHELHASKVLAAEQLGMNSCLGGQQFHNMSTWQAFCEEAGMKTQFDQEELVEYFPSARSFLHSVKKIGANSSRGNTESSPSLMRKLLQIYDERYIADKGVPATYEAIYAVCVQVEQACILT